MIHKDYDLKGSVAKYLWSWASRGLLPRQTDWQETVSRKVTLTDSASVWEWPTGRMLKLPLHPRRSILHSHWDHILEYGDHYLEAKSIGMVLGSEIHMYPATKFKCSQYITYGSDRRNQQGGGSAVLTRQGFRYFEVLLPPSQNMESTAVRLSINKLSIILISASNPPSTHPANL
jgi:hypothetical protein